MKTRSWIAIIVTTILVAAGLQAQPRGGEDRSEAQLKELKEKVSLTDDQTVKVRTIMKKAQEDRRAIWENSDGDREAMRGEMMKLMEKTDAEIAKVLTPKQMPKYEEYKKERQKRMQERMRERQ